MRYIYYIFIILFGLSAIIGYELRDKEASPKEAAIIVNDKVITAEEFNRLYSSKSGDKEDKGDFINSLITKELLIQEAEKEGIDKGEAFRISIQNFYEQSLIKLLMDRKCGCINANVTDDELNRYITLLNAKIYFTIFDFDSIEEAHKGNYRDGESRGVYFEDLSKDMRNSIISLKEGQVTEPVKNGEKYAVVRLDKIEHMTSRMPSDLEKEKIKKMLAEERKEKLLNDWVVDLRKRAAVKILISEKN